MQDERDDLTETEREGLRKLQRDVDPPDAMEVRIATELGRRRTRRTARWAASVAVVAIAGAFFAGRFSVARPTQPAGERFMLLLYGGPSGSNDRVAEYGAWARQVRDSGYAIRGDRLDAGGQFIGASNSEGAASEQPSGYFIVVAPNYDAAVDIARGSPHIRYGGRILVRRIPPS